MRPVDKGEAPQEYTQYKDAEKDLEARLGAYCSFCEMPINHAPEVEHKEAKAKGGAELEWENLLLSCKYCNTRKGTRVGKGDKEKYLWPDEDDTFHAYLYDKDLPRLNEAYLEGKGKEERDKAERLFDLLQLDHFPLTPKDKDRRYRSRNEARNCALENKKTLEKLKDSSLRKAFLKQTEQLALATGFFSVWMEVFKDDKEVRQMLISSFKGTKEEYCKDFE